MRRIRYILEVVLVVFLFAIFRLLPLDVSSWLGGKIAQIVGPRMRAHRYARENLALAFPEKSNTEREDILSRMWNNLGRNAAEFSSLPGKRLTTRVQIAHEKNLPDPKNPVLFFGGHIANWELLSSVAFDRGIPISLIYRHINNPYIDKLVYKMRGTHAIKQFPKGPKGGVGMLRALKNGESVAMLIDQKMNGGIAIPFFGRDAMTAPAIAELSLKLDLPIIPARIVREKGAHFTGHLYPPIACEKTGDKEKDVKVILTRINQLLEEWIREHPEQWFWVHRRWPKNTSTMV